MTEIVPPDDAAALTRHIETRYHRRHRQQLPPLVKMAQMVEDLHCGDEDVPMDLSAILQRILDEVEMRTRKEELSLFPAIRNGASADALAGSVAAMRADHRHHLRDIAEIRRLTRGLALPRDACRTWITLYEGLAEFIADLEEHIRLENQVLLPPTERGASPHG